jgi:PAS domain S-box-containing protein
MRASDCPAAESSEFLLATLEQAGDAVVVLDRNLRVINCNAAAELIWGTPRAQLLGREAGALGLRDLQPRPIAAPESDPMHDGNLTAGPGVEMTIRRHDGSRVRVALSVLRVEADGQNNTMVFARDITAEFLRRERFTLLSLVADKTDRAVVITDPDLKIVYVNAAFEARFGYSVEQAMGQHAHRLLAGRATDRRILARLQRRISDENGGDEEILLYDRNGDESWVSASVKAFRNKQGGSNTSSRC